MIMSGVKHKPVLFILILNVQILQNIFSVK